MSENVANKTLSPAQRRALAALASGKGKSAAAVAAGVSERTLDRYFQDPAFCVALDGATSEAIRDAARGLLASLDTAVSTLKTIAENKNEAAGTRVRAAEKIISLGLELWTAHNLAERVKRLEEAANSEN